MNRPTLLLIFTLLFMNKTSLAQANCCNNDTIYFENYIDCPICIEVSCIDSTSMTISPLPVEIINDSTGYNNSNLLLLSCPPNNCNTNFTVGYILCGGPNGPQTGKIVLPSGTCTFCNHLKFTVKKIGSTILTPELSVTSPGTNTSTYINSPCCSILNQPNAELTFDCSSNKLTLKCVN